jgi:hypothetical protein
MHGSLQNSLDNRREELVDFADRYERGAPYEGISEVDVVRRYREVLSSSLARITVTRPTRRSRG